MFKTFVSLLSGHASYTPYQTETAHCLHHTRQKQRTACTILDRTSPLHAPYQTETAHCLRRTRQKQPTAYTIQDRNSALHTPYQTETAHCVHRTRHKERTAYTIPDRNSALYTPYQTETAYCIHHTRQKKRTVYTIADGTVTTDICISTLWNRVSTSRSCKRFFLQNVQTGSGTYQVSYSSSTGALTADVKQQLGSESDPSPPACVEVKNLWSYTLLSLMLSWRVQGQLYLYLYRWRPYHGSGPLVGSV
jgi:hypothetical protein